ncbi:MAG: ABC transporter permease, partial [Candidatus Acidiferrales bacterium]
MPDWAQYVRQNLRLSHLKPEREAEIVEDLAGQLDEAYREALECGLTQARAEAAAMQHVADWTSLANELVHSQRGKESAMTILQHKVEARDATRGRFSLLTDLRQDICYGLRMLRKSPGFTAVAVLTLALGIGANTAIFSVINSVLLQRLPFPQPERVIVLHRWTGSSIPYAEFQDMEAQNHSFELLALQRRESMNLTGAGEPERVIVRMVSPDFFPILGLKPLLGRTYTKDEDRLGAPGVVVITQGLWTRKFNSDPAVVGRSATLAGKNYTIIGVVPDLPSQFAQTDFFYPIGQWDEPAFRVRGSGFGTVGLARLNPEVTLAQARADLKRLAGVLAAAYPKEDGRLTLDAVPFRTDTLGTLQHTLLLLFGAVGFVLLIACANVANLILARSTSRRRELAIRVAVGAGRERVVRQLLTETSLLGILGGGVGLLLAKWGMLALVEVAPRLSLGVEPSINIRVLLFTLTISLLTGILFGTVPAFKAARVDLQETLKEGGRGATGGHQRVQAALVVSEIALAMVLLAGAGLLVRSLERIWQVNPGFDPRNVLTFTIALSPDTATSAPKIRQMYSRLMDGLEALPGAASASLVFGNLPFTGESDINFWREDRKRPDRMSDAPDALWYAVTPDYLRAMGIPLLRGRFLTPQDTETAPVVAVINDGIARTLFPNEDPLGKRLHLTFFDRTAEIVGIVGTVKHFGLDVRPDNDILFQLYIPFRQVPDGLVPLLAMNSSVAVRTATEPASLTGAVRHEVRTVDDQQVMFGETTMQELLDGSLAFRRSSMILLEVFAALALLLASIGVYGVISNIVGQRAHEIGVRMALGAQRGNVLRLVLGRGVKLGLLGVALGIAAALPLMRLLSSMLFGVTAADPLTFAAV